MKIDEMTQGCTNSTVNYTDLLGCVNLLNEAKKAANEALKADFISALARAGQNDNLIKEVEQKGLPSHIIMSDDIFCALESVFRKYGKPINAGKVDTTIMFAWAGENCTCR